MPFRMAQSAGIKKRYKQQFASYLLHGSNKAREPTKIILSVKRLNILYKISDSFTKCRTSKSTKQTAVMNQNCSYGSRFQMMYININFAVSAVPNITMVLIF